MLKKGFRKEWPVLTLASIEARRTVLAPACALAARRRAHRITKDSRWAEFIDYSSGYALFGPDGFPELAQVVEACNAIYRRHRDRLLQADTFNKNYYFNILDRDDLARHPVLLDFALSDPVAQATTGYLSRVPRLHSVGVFYSPVNETIDGSQKFHVDGDARSQVKCFVNVWDVAPGDGEFTFIPKPLTSSRLRHGGLLKTLSDANVTSAVAEDLHVRVLGPAGSGVLVDTSRCLHQGSRARNSPRLVFQFQYVSRPDALVPKAGQKPVRGGHVVVTRELLTTIGFSHPRVQTLVD